MKRRRSLIGWLTALCLVVSLAQPGTLLAQDDDDDDDDGVPGISDDGDDDEGAPPPATDDGDDGGGDDDGGGVPPPATDSDDDGDGDVNGGAPPLAAGDDDDDDDDGDDDDGGAPPLAAGDDDSDDGDDVTLNDSILELDDDDNDDATDRSISNQALVQLDQGVDAGEFASRHGAAVLRVIPVPNIVLLRLDSAEGDEQELNALTDDADVIWGERNYTSQAPEGRPRYFFISATGVPQIVDGPALPDGLEYTPAEACVTGESVAVAVLDTGVDIDHPALASNVLPNGVNMIENTFDVRDLPNGIDDNNDGQVDEMVGHGTHVAGIVLQVAPDAAILPVKVLRASANRCGAERCWAQARCASSCGKVYRLSV